MPDYKKGKIYKIVCNLTGKIYIGSTIETLARRLSGHRSAYKRFKESKSNCCTSFQIIEQGEFDIVLIENCPCESNEELHRQERHFIESLDCVNKVIPTRTDKEYYQVNKQVLLEYKKHYNQDNTRYINERQRAYYQNKKQIILEKANQYYETNKQLILEQKKKFYLLNKDAMNEKRRKYRLKKKTENEILP